MPLKGCQALLMQVQHHQLLGQLHWAALVALCWHGQHCLPKITAAWCAPSSEFPKVAVLAELFCAET